MQKPVSILFFSVNTERKNVFGFFGFLLFLGFFLCFTGYVLIRDSTSDHLTDHDDEPNHREHCDYDAKNSHCCVWVDAYPVTAKMGFNFNFLRSALREKMFLGFLDFLLFLGVLGGHSTPHMKAAGPSVQNAIRAMRAPSENTTMVRITIKPICSCVVLLVVGCLTNYCKNRLQFFS